jgi:hypothetical protein
MCLSRWAVVLPLFIMSGCRDRQAEPSGTVSPPAASSAPPASSGSATAASSAPPASSGSAAAAPNAAGPMNAAPAGPGARPNVPPTDFAIECRTSVTAKDTIGVRVASMKPRDPLRGTLTVNGVALGTRRFNVRATPYAATYVLLFESYGAGDNKPAKEALTAGKSIVARLVANGDQTDLYFDGDVDLVRSDEQPVAQPLRCE